MALCSCRRGPNVEKGKWYGVRSYLHLFYEDCAGAVTDIDLDGVPNSHEHHGWHAVLWKVCLSAGTLLFLIGIAALTTSYLVPQRLEGIGEGEFVVLDQKAVEFNHALTTCKVVGIVLCATATLLLGSSCVSTIMCRATRDSQEEEEEQLSPILKENHPPLVTPSPIDTFGCKRMQCVQPQRDT